MSRKTQTLIIFFLLTVIWDLYKRQREKAEYAVLLNNVRRNTAKTTTVPTGTTEVDNATIVALQNQLAELTTQFEDFQTLNGTVLPLG